jgi:hypothetical protein
MGSGGLYEVSSSFSVGRAGTKEEQEEEGRRRLNSVDVYTVGTMEAPLVPSNCLENIVKEEASCANSMKSEFRNSWRERSSLIVKVRKHHIVTLIKSRVNAR